MRKKERGLFVIILILGIIYFGGCEKEPTGNSNQANNLLGEWKYELLNQIDGACMCSSVITYNFSEDEFEIEYEYSSYEIENPSNTDNSTSIIKADYTILSENLLEGEITYEEVNGEIQYDFINFNFVNFYNIIDDVAELSCEQLYGATTEFNQIEGDQNTLVNSSFHSVYDDIDSDNFHHRKLFFTADSIYRYWMTTQSESIPENWEDPEIYPFEIINETTLYVWYDGIENDETLEKYLLTDDKFYLGDDYKSFHKQ